MKFDFAIGNPPYQDNAIGENDTYAPPVYNKFLDAAYAVADSVEMIHPARFLFNAGSTPKAWNEKMLNDPHFKVMHYEEDASKVFANTDIKGGVAITYRTSDAKYEPIVVFTKYPALNHILHKVNNTIDFVPMDTLVVTRTASAMGVCLSFNVGELYKCLYGYNDIMFNEVFYNDSITNDAYFEIVKKYFDKGNIDIYSSEEELIRQLIYAGNLHKHKSFKNEHEIRITTMDNKSPYGTEYALKEIGNVVKKVYILKPDIMGNSKGTSLEKIIDEVIVGPRSQQNINILRQYIYSNGLYDLADRITMSECPLR